LLFDKLMIYHAFLVLLLGVGLISIFSDDGSKCQQGNWSKPICLDTIEGQ
jgi:hypothetical protein